jgi:ribosome-binding protein aMBF1 (putative translation factor)
LVKIQAKHIDDIETGKKSTRISTLAKIAWALDVSLRELLGDGEEKKRVEIGNPSCRYGGRDLLPNVITI